MKKIILPLTFSFVLLVLYQNCGDVSLTSPSKTLTHLDVDRYSTVDFCIEHGKDLYSFLAINLNAIPYKGGFLADSDMDGIPDIEDSDPVNPRQFGLLDRICRDEATCDHIQCVNSDYYQLGVTNCDLSAYTNPTPPNIMDSDFDGIPDFIEIIRGSDPFRSPFNIPGGDPDLDGDGRTLLQEIIDQTDPHFNDQDSDYKRYRPKIYLAENNSSCQIPNKLYKIVVPDIPFVNVLEYNDPLKLNIGSEYLNLSHRANENIIAVYIITNTVSLPNTNYRGYLQLIRLHSPEYTYPGIQPMYQFNLFNDDFLLVGEWND